LRRVLERRGRSRGVPLRIPARGRSAPGATVRRADAGLRRIDGIVPPSLLGAVEGGLQICLSLPHSPTDEAPRCGRRLTTSQALVRGAFDRCALSARGRGADTAAGTPERPAHRSFDPCRRELHRLCGVLRPRFEDDGIEPTEHDLYAADRVNAAAWAILVREAHGHPLDPRRILPELRAHAPAGVLPQLGSDGYA
jgi:hypothetical protein